MKKRIIEMICLIVLVVGAICCVEVVVNLEKSDSSSELNQKKVEKYVTESMKEIVENNWEYEFIKTMAVIIRTRYVYEYIADEDNILDDKLETSKNDNSEKDNKKGKYKISKRISDNISKAIDETKGEIITYQKNVVYPFYHEVSPRVTRVDDKIIGKKVEYLKQKECIDDIKSKEFFQIKYFNKKDILDRLYKSDEIKEIKKGEFTITNADKNGYVFGMKVDGKIDVDVYEFVRILGLNSINFTISTYAENHNILRVVCRGKGHGFGLSMYDGNNLAKKGLGYEEIIDTYYKDIIIKKCIYE